MRRVVFALVAAFLFGATVAQAEEGSVYVNLSVLDALGSAEAVTEPASPLFPIVKPAPKKVMPKKKPAPKPIKKKPEPKKEAPKPIAKAPLPEPKVEVRQVPVIEETEEVIVVEVEPVTAKDVSQSTPHIEAVAKPVAEIKPEPKAEPLAPAEPDVVTEPTPAEDALAPKLLVEEPVAKPSLIDARIVFENDVVELNEAQKAQIDAVIASFADAEKNKIAIYSYNLDDGNDSFRKKRQSLNRAVEIRSYLLQKGYKNFSIKVLNIDSGSDKINAVELEELK